MVTTICSCLSLSPTPLKRVLEFGIQPAHRAAGTVLVPGHDGLGFIASLK